MLPIASQLKEESLSQLPYIAHHFSNENIEQQKYIVLQNSRQYITEHYWQV